MQRQHCLGRPDQVSQGPPEAKGISALAREEGVASIARAPPLPRGPSQQASISARAWLGKQREATAFSQQDRLRVERPR